MTVSVPKETIARRSLLERLDSDPEKNDGTDRKSEALYARVVKRPRRFVRE
jgi:hypothetical protein